MTFETQVFQDIYPGNLCLLQPLTVLLLLASADTRAADLPKAVVNLEPPWINVFQGDYVTLKCHGAHTPGNNSIQWFHRGIPIPTQIQPSYSFNATASSSGEYRCQTSQTSLSDPVQLDVFSGVPVKNQPLKTMGHSSTLMDVVTVSQLDSNLLTGRENTLDTISLRALLLMFESMSTFILYFTPLYLVNKP
ncbi:low affinity immunoglobulin gamma Fc region receptor II-a-like isoform X5 [Trichechus manatus latirostris]|uniref:low affinity immunoglobulin gamma Fc region receptor II-a-like isoform X5 n=1 Tax=Trichechus manatus latirostris TaxID=127582 RepID=UPI000CA0369B|nr:low affinity immunoglobulin gamma Fc region receptor II-a-like isoform X5 [Trichechus manatus latirostris]